jgi:transcriptional regulator with XRE-family HTH domain
MSRIGDMDGRRAGRIIRAVRHAMGLRQADVADRARVSQSTVSRVELGRIGHIDPITLDQIARVLDIRLFLDARWDGGDADRLVDKEHASIVELVADTLRDLGWIILVEYSFNSFGERGSVDLLAWHPGRRALLIVEVKSRLTDLQATFSSFHRKVRLVPGIVREEMRWDALTVGRLLVLPGTTRNRNVVKAHAATFAAMFPERMPRIGSWLRRPTGSMSGIWFLAATAKRRPSRRRIRSTAAPR